MRHCGRDAIRQQEWNRSKENWCVQGEPDPNHIRDVDDDLILFNDMTRKDNKGLLHPPNDNDIGEVPLQSSKFRGLTGFSVSPSSTPHWKGNDLLATDADKNDYDWLLTPPGTPLFPLLERGEPVPEHAEPPMNLIQTHTPSRASGLRRSNPREIQSGTPRRNHSMTMTPTSATSPSIASSSPRSTSSLRRGRTPSPSSRTGSSPALRPATPTKATGLSRSTTTTNRASSSSVRPSTPVLRRMNTSPSVRSSSTERTIPTTPKGGRSQRAPVSPKLHAWQALDLGFSDEPPPNLRTCISIRPGSRGSSSMLALSSSSPTTPSYSEAAAETGSRPLSQWRNSSSSGSRVSSTTASQDYWSSRGSVVSSSDDGTDTIEPTFLDFNAMSPPHPTLEEDTRVAENEVSSWYRPNVIPNKRSATSGETSASLNATVRKSLESSMRRPDHHHHVSQSMFRPLLSSAPSSFYTTHHRPASPILESSITASTTASSAKDVRMFSVYENAGNEDSGNDITGNKKGSSPPITNTIEADGAGMLNLEYTESPGIDADTQEQGSVTDNTAHALETETRIMWEQNIVHEPELKETLKETNENCCEMPVSKEENTFTTKFPITEQILNNESIDIDPKTVSSEQQPRSMNLSYIEGESNPFKRELDCDGIHQSDIYYHELNKPGPLQSSQCSNQEMIPELAHRTTDVPDKSSLQVGGNSMPDVLNNAEDCKVFEDGSDQFDKEALRLMSRSEGEELSNHEESSSYLQFEDLGDSELLIQPNSMKNHADLHDMVVESSPDSSAGIEKGKKLISQEVFVSDLDCEIKGSINARKTDSDHIETDLPSSVNANGRDSCHQIKVNNLPPDSPSYSSSSCRHELNSQNNNLEDCIGVLDSKGNVVLQISDKNGMIIPRYLADVDGYQSENGQKVYSFQLDTVAINCQEQIIEQSEDQVQFDSSLTSNSLPDEVEIENERDICIPFQQVLQGDMNSEFGLAKKPFAVEDPVPLASEVVCPGATTVPKAESSDKTKVVGLMNPGSDEQNETTDFLANINTIRSSAEPTEITDSLTDVREDLDNVEPNKIMDLEEDKHQSSHNVEPAEATTAFLIIDVNPSLDGSEPTETTNSLKDNYQSTSCDDDSTDAKPSPEDVHPHPDCAEPTETTTSSLMDDGHPTIPHPLDISPEEANDFVEADDTNRNGIMVQMETMSISTESPQYINTNEATVENSAKANFCFDETTNRILFCSSIVHEIVYKAANIAAEKEAATLATLAPKSLEERRQFLNSEYIRSLRGTISRTVKLKGRQKETKSASMASDKDETLSVAEPITQQPVPIDGMMKDGDEAMVEEKEKTSEASNQIKLGANSNCNCIVM